MNFAELLPDVKRLSRAEKIRLIRLLSEDLERDENNAVPGAEGATAETALELVHGGDLPVWSPVNAHDAAAALLRVLEADRERA